MAKVLWPNGTINELRDDLAERLANKRQCRILRPVAAKPAPEALAPAELPETDASEAPRRTKKGAK